MTVLDAALRSVASTLVGQFGTDVTLVIPGTTQNEDTGVVSGSDTTETHKGSVQRYRVDQIDGTRILPGDVKVILAAADWTATPTAGQRIRFGGHEHQVVNVSSTYSGDQVASYVVQARL